MIPAQSQAVAAKETPAPPAVSGHPTASAEVAGGRGNPLSAGRLTAHLPILIAAALFLALVDPISAGIAAVWTGEIAIGGQLEAEQSA